MKSVNPCLKRAVGWGALSYEELRSILVEIEATLNNRPLTYVYEQGISYPLTPSAWIYGRTIAMTRNEKHFEVISTHESLTRREKHHSRLLNQVTKQSRDEYLVSLRESSKLTNGTNKNSVDVEDLVIMKCGNSARVL